MEEIELDLNEKKRGSFHFEENGQRVGEMEIGISDNRLVVYHTEVEEEGKGIARKLLEFMVDYARQNKLGVVPLCPYVLAQFNKNPQKYADVWVKLSPNSDTGQ
jgi:predicted GNAT family acetyltransferase